MSEVLDTQFGQGPTAEGRFFMPVDVDSVPADAPVASAEPMHLTPDQARAELHTIFSGESGAEAQRLYQQGLKEIMVPGNSKGGTPALDLYIRVQTLAFDAAAAFDRPRN